MAPNTSIPDTTIAGINGIKVHDHFAYYTNTGDSTVYRMPISSDGTLNGTAEVVAADLPCDDLLVTDEAIYVPGSDANVAWRVADGQRQILAGVPGSNSSGVIGVTAVQLGTGPSDRRNLYVTTNAGVLTQVEGSAGLSRIDLGVGLE